MPELAPVMLTAEQFSLLATKDYIDKKLTDFATKDDLKNFATKVDKQFYEIDLKFNKIDKRFDEIDLKFNKIDKRFDEINLTLERLEYKVDTTFAYLEKNVKDNDLNHEIRIKRVESMIS